MVIRQTVSVPGLGHGAQPIPLGVSIGPIFVTGNISGVDIETGEPPAEVAKEFDNAFGNAGRVLRAAGLELANIAKIDILLRDLKDRDVLNEAWVAWFPDAQDRPARHTSQAELPRNLRIQISVLAVRV